VITLALIGVVAGLLAGVSPCILAVLPVVFLAGAQGARTGARRTTPQPIDRRRPYLVALGLALSFSLITVFGSLVLTALHLPQDALRWAALVVLVLLGIAMMVPRFEELLQRPFARLPSRRPRSTGFVLGLALGALYVPCAGPILAAIIVAAATGNFGVRTFVLTIAFALGTAVPLLFFALAGRGLAERLRLFRSHQRGIRITGGAVVIALALLMTFHLTDALQRLVPDYTAAPANALNHNNAVANALGHPDSGALATCQQYVGSATLEECGGAPAINGITGWLNTPNGTPISMATLSGSVVLVDFWAYSCVNCQRAIAHVSAWYKAYHASGFDVIGVHTPEYSFEKVASNVAAGAQRLGITYPVALDDNYRTWDNYNNDSWPADYLIDATGNIRFVYLGEGDYPGMESLIRQLLSAAHPGIALSAKTDVPDTTPTSQTQTPETYLGAQRANTFVGGPLGAGEQTFAYPHSIQDDQFALTGTWVVSDESLTAKADAGIALNFQADDVYLDVGGTGTVTATLNGQTTTYAVSGAPNIYTLVQGPTEQTGVLKVTLSPGLSAYSFTFG
jgi:cytochrome c biogenesis protein CcdA/thiol-disulfide isomerase/thioredoxin